MSMGTTATLQHRCDEALTHFRRVLDVRKRLLPPGHVMIAAALQGIEHTLSCLGLTAGAADAGAAAAGMMRRSQCACAGPGCTRKLREDGAPLDVCVNCRRTFYCGKACQTAGWKAECKALVAEGRRDSEARDAKKT